ncbi:selenoprotein Pb-like [Gigantopelta aegis]|uniref:selenoprotein Pb-like n=1 Tax=Gigantopelta aegis TaxID=1735272 RepID=UPI001B888163|nr:selenoprotein Pb-like [Gigantopelta aegis]
MFIINHHDHPSVLMANALTELVPFPVYQDSTQLHLWRDIFQGSKDDFFVFDKCGKLTYHIPFPQSYLGYSYTHVAIINTYQNNICNCSQDSGYSGDMHDRMLGDAPSQPEHAVSQNAGHVLPKCAAEDGLCRILHRIRGRHGHRSVEH